ncbi:MAG: toll/interleukin-1 receptor domain-containing protein [Dehalococcoidia bacterium]
MRGKLYDFTELSRAGTLCPSPDHPRESAAINAAVPYVFLSYTSTDRDRALEVAGALESSGVAVWLDRQSIAGGSSWSAEIVRGIQGCAALVALCSQAAMVSPNVQRELQLGMEEQRPPMHPQMRPPAPNTECYIEHQPSLQPAHGRRLQQ